MSRTSTMRPPMSLDLTILVAVAALVSFGVVMLYSTTAIFAADRYSDELFFVRRQMGAALVGAILMVVLARVPLSLIWRYSALFLPLAVLLVSLPLIPGIGDSAGGARRWVNIGIGRFQPGEFAKLCTIIFMAGYIARHEEKLAGFVSGLAKPMALVGMIAALFLMHPDFGSAAVTVMVCICMLIVSGVRLRHMLGVGAVLGIVAGILVATSPYRLARVTTFLSPLSDPSGKGYQLIQSLIAVATGRGLGVGLGESQQKLFFLPAAHTDFIFAVIAEELGFVGALAVVGGFLVVLWRGVVLARRVPQHAFAFSLVVGCTMLIVVPALLNVGVVIGLLPTKGMVLPFVGYGGSSLVASLAAVGVLLSVARSINRNDLSSASER